MNKLPTIDHPIFSINVPSLKKEYKFRPFLVKEEKILLMAKESKSETDIFVAIKQIVQNCCLDKKLVVDKLSIFDLEYIFLKLRSISIDNIVKITFKDFEDSKIYDFEVDIEEIKVVFSEKANNNIKINSQSGIIMNYPSASLYSDKDFLSLKKDHLFELIVRCVDKIYSGEEVYEAKNFAKKDIETFLENLSVKVFEQVQSFLLSTPKLEHTIKYKNSLGNDREIVLNKLSDFFSLR
jgi:hypothetical protein